MATAKRLRVTQIRGASGKRRRHQACLRGLGLRRTNHTVVLEDTPAIRGLINRVAYMVRYEEV